MTYKLLRKDSILQTEYFGVSNFSQVFLNFYKTLYYLFLKTTILKKEVLIDFLLKTKIIIRFIAFFIEIKKSNSLILNIIKFKKNLILFSLTSNKIRI